MKKQQEAEKRAGRARQLRDEAKSKQVGILNGSCKILFYKMSSKPALIHFSTVHLGN